MTKTAAEIFRDYETDGDSSSGAHKPIKSDIRDWGKTIDGFGSYYPVISPSSNGTAFQGSGYPITHQLAWTDSNLKLWADQFQIESHDPSANFTISLGGTLTAGDVITLHFLFGSTDIAVPYTVTAGDVSAGALQVLNNIAAAIHSVSTLWNLPTTDNVVGGGYANGALFGLLSLSTPNFLNFDYDVRVAPLSVKYAVSGAATEVITVYSGLYNGTLTPGGSAPNTAYQVPNALDGNPGTVFTRFVDGVVPARGSIIGGWTVTSNNSALPHALGLSYGSIIYTILDATSGGETGCWWLQGMKAGASGFGVRIGSGVFSVYGESVPNDGTGVVDKGAGTYNCGTYYWIANVYKIGQNGTTFEINATNGNPIKLTGGAASSDQTFTGKSSGGGSGAALVASAAIAGISWDATGGAADTKWWDAISVGATLSFRAVSDDQSSANAWMTVARSGTAIASVTFPAGALTEFFINLSADYTLTDSSAAQKAFNSTTNGAITPLAATAYEFEAVYHITNTGTTSHTWAVLFGGTATLTSMAYNAMASTAVGNALAAVSQIRGVDATATVVTPASTSATENVEIVLRGVIRVNAAGTLIPQVKLSAATGGTEKMLANSYFRMWPIGSNTVTNAGNWS